MRSVPVCVHVKERVGVLLAGVPIWKSTLLHCLIRTQQRPDPGRAETVNAMTCCATHIAAAGTNSILGMTHHTYLHLLVARFDLLLNSLYDAVLLLLPTATTAKCFTPPTMLHSLLLLSVLAAVAALIRAVHLPLVLTLIQEAAAVQPLLTGI